MPTTQRTPQLNKATKEHFLKALSSIERNQEGFEIFLRIMLTPAEYKEVLQRWEILCLLEEGVPQRAIAQQLGTGIATVSRGSREWKAMGTSIRKLLKK